MKMRKFLLDKLGRDNVKKLFEEDGCTIKYHTLENDEEYLDALSQKLVEELEEVFECETREEVISELADLEDILIHFKELIKVDQKDIDAARKKKVAKNGSYTKRIYLEYAQVPEGSKTFEYFMANPERFPEIIEEITDDTKKDS